jgi:hypothetical protein
MEMVKCSIAWQTRTVTKAECDYCKWIWNWPSCYTVNYLAGQAIGMTKRIYGHTRDNTRANAFQHCYWSALITRAYGASTAKGFTDRHEAGAPGTWLQHMMDYVNNAVGRRVASSIGYPAAFNADASRKCREGPAMVLSW